MEATGTPLNVATALNGTTTPCGTWQRCPSPDDPWAARCQMDQGARILEACGWPPKRGAHESSSAGASARSQIVGSGRASNLARPSTTAARQDFSPRGVRVSPCKKRKDLQCLVEVALHTPEGLVRVTHLDHAAKPHVQRHGRLVDLGMAGNPQPMS